VLVVEKRKIVSVFFLWLAASSCAVHISSNFMPQSGISASPNYIAGFVFRFLSVELRDFKGILSVDMEISLLGL
jgi:hypothetical protein